MNYRETTNRLKNAITGNVHRAALVGGAAVVLTGVVAAPAMAFASQTPSTAPAAVVTTHDASGGTASHLSAKTTLKPGAKKVTVVKKAPAAKAPAAKTPAAKAPSSKQMNPRSITDAQSTFNISAEQMANAKKIIAQGQRMHLPPRAWVIALATSSQETKLHNYGRLANNDHDSLGLFQQRPSSGWGAPNQLVNPSYAAGKFYSALEQVPNWKSLPVTVAAQSVQVSAFPDRYAQWEKLATNLILATYGQGPYAHVAGAH